MAESTNVPEQFHLVIPPTKWLSRTYAQNDTGLMWTLHSTPLSANRITDRLPYETYSLSQFFSKVEIPMKVDCARVKSSQLQTVRVQTSGL